MHIVVLMLSEVKYVAERKGTLGAFSFLMCLLLETWITGACWTGPNQESTFVASEGPHEVFIFRGACDSLSSSQPAGASISFNKCRQSGDGGRALRGDAEETAGRGPTAPPSGAKGTAAARTGLSRPGLMGKTGSDSKKG